MSEKIEVSKIVLKMGKKKVELSLAEAKELQELLNDIFGKKEIINIPNWPVYIKRQSPWPHQRWTTSYDCGKLTYSLTDNKKG